MTTRVKLLALILVTVFWSCGNNENRTKDHTTSCNPYFTHYDKVEHYYYDISEDEIWKAEEKGEKTFKERRQLELLIQNIPEKLSDTAILKNIDKIGFVKKDLAKSKFAQLDEIFCERKHEDGIAMACIAIYRDILVFKKANKIVGTAKICFECGKNIITGTAQNTDEFGQSGDYDKLYRLLH